MTAIVFIGPTIPEAEARAELDAVYLPPASHGDIYRAACRRPSAIGLVDGLFERRPAVWHKEILWAMREGVHVFGASSMGALRAAELEAFGMVGVGSIFEAFRDGAVEDDDEVAVAHADAEAGYVCQSEAMMNIRATLEAAVAASVVTTATGAALVALAKSLFYPSRAWPVILARARSAGLPPAELDRLHAWLPQGRVDRKREDAIALLRVIHELGPAPPTKRVRYHFEHTELWEQATRVMADSREAEPGISPVVEELRLVPAAYERARAAAAARMLELRQARRWGLEADATECRAVSDVLRRELGLESPQALNTWARTAGLDEAGYDRLVADEAAIRRTRARLAPHVEGHLLDHLRISGEYAALAARGREKAQALESDGSKQLALADTGLSWDELVAWYFSERLGVAAPASLGEYARHVGFANLHDFRMALIREHRFVTRQEQGALFDAGTDPYQFYDSLRPGRVSWDDELSAWLVTGFDDVRAALRDKRLVCPVAVDNDRSAVASVQDELDALLRFRCLVVQHRQGAGHATLRRAMRGDLSGAALGRMEPLITAEASRLLARASNARALDIVEDFARPLAAHVMAAAIGLPEADAPTFLRCCERVFYVWPAALEHPDPATSVRVAHRALIELARYVGELLDARRVKPQEDMATTFAGAVDRDEITFPEAVANLSFVYESGRHTTANLVANSVLGLISHPQQFASLCASPEQSEAAMRELMRFDTPGVSVVRVAADDMCIGATKIQAGDRVFPMLGAANRDPARFSEPTALRFDRADGPNLGFGGGPHHCIGAPLARLEVAVALRTLAEQAPELRMGNGTPEWELSPATRRLALLPVCW